MTLGLLLKASVQDGAPSGFVLTAESGIGRLSTSRGQTKIIFQATVSVLPVGTVLTVEAPPTLRRAHLAIPRLFVPIRLLATNLPRHPTVARAIMPQVRVDHLSRRRLPHLGGRLLCP